MRHRLLPLVLACACLSTVACGEFGYGDWGVSPGGAQDIGYAREFILAGGVPQPEDIFTEGLLSEHDLPAPGDACEDLMCLRPASAIAPDLGRGELVHWVHVGMMSGLSKAEFERPPVDLVVAIDKSALMSVDMAETTTALHTLVDSLRPDDRLGLIAFDTGVHELRQLVPIADAQEVHEIISSIHPSGSWQIGPAVEYAYDMLADAPLEPERLHRVMVLSCAYPVLSEEDDFSQIVRDGADAGIGMSFFGVLLGHDAALANLLGTERGGAYYYLDSFERIEQVFDVGFDESVTPIAYDLSISIAAEPGYELLQVDGIPGSTPTEARFEVATAFISSRDGGIVARFDAVEPGDTIATLVLDYEPESALGWSDPEHQLELAAAPSGEGYGSLGVRKAVFLVNQAERMRDACSKYHDGQRGEAREILDELLEYMLAEQEVMNQSDLDIEVELVKKLRENMQ
jgi:Ca-activated chloride channel family protein